MTPLDIAQVAHEINKAYCEALGDTTQVAWDKAPDWQKESAVKGVEMHLASPNATPEDSHISWLKQKEADGWKYGEVKDAEKKEHPCFRPYSELPVEQRTKDFLFRQTVHSLAPFLSKEAEVVEAPILEPVKVLTNGMQEIDVTFNVGNREDVHAIKMAAATFYDVVEAQVAQKMRAEYNTGSPTTTQSAMIGKINRLKALALTSIEMGAVQAVKAITR